MKKQQFIDEAKRLGFEKHQELVALLGYNKRTLSRYKPQDKISSNFVQAFEDYKKAQKGVSVSKSTKNDKQKGLVIINEQQKSTTKKQENIIDAEIVIEVNTDEENEIKKGGAKEKHSNKKIFEKHTIGIDISNEDYHNSNNMGVSKLKVMIDNAKEFEEKHIKKTIERKETDALTIGKLHHTLVLEPHKFDEDYIVIDMPARVVKDDLIQALEALGGNVDVRMNSRDEIVVADTVDMLKEKIEDIKITIKKTICTKAQVELAIQTSKKALNSWFEIIVKGETILKAQLKDILELEKCYVEKTFYGTINDVDVQVRPDILVNLGAKVDIWFVIDLKTLEVATPNMFVKQGGAFYWDMQEQFYLEVLRQNEIDAQAFYFNCAGKKEFSGAGFYEWSGTTKEDAKRVVQAGMKKYKYCIENNIFLESKFDYVKIKFEAITTLDVPAYRQHQMGDLGV